MADKKYPQFILFGDSIIQFATSLGNGAYNFGAGLEEHCSRRLDVINRGFSGYNTAHALKILPDIIPDPSAAKVDYLLVLFGANDSCLPDCPSKQHVPLDQYQENIKNIINHPLVQAHNPEILVVTPPLINEAHLKAEDAKKGYEEVSRENMVTSQYATAVRDAVAEVRSEKVHVVDLWKAMMMAFGPNTSKKYDKEEFPNNVSGDNDGLRALLVDGLHLTGEGYKMFLKQVLPFVGPDWAAESATAPSWIFPHWSVAPRIDDP
ncbi:GDSL Lipase/Acylhydrolase family protein-like protein [Calycina marina]|uniref:GDSL Lipase/Acylhydrolase family protein-like protein n=1 Tax=Calycina marina TaxID=1763456 RepID=A0A9P7Z0U3_9HELO|nr:GDSL Lipase/Acylhydrolase family protein-like protein [Calycina marina]